MGQITKSGAESKRDEYVRTLTSVKNNVTKNFDDMDLENVDQRDKIEGFLITGTTSSEGIVEMCDDLITKLNNMTFE